MGRIEELREELRRQDELLTKRRQQQAANDERPPNRRIEDIQQVADVSRRVEEQVVGQSRGNFVPFTNVEPASPLGEYQVGNVVVFRAPIVRTMRLKRWTLAVRVKTTNDATHYWNFTLRTDVTGTIDTLDTSALSPNTWSTLELTTFAVPVVSPSTDIYIEIYITESGNAGHLEVSPALYVI